MNYKVIFLWIVALLGIALIITAIVRKTKCGSNNDCKSSNNWMGFSGLILLIFAVGLGAKGYSLLGATGGHPFTYDNIDA